MNIYNTDKETDPARLKKIIEYRENIRLLDEAMVILYARRKEQRQMLAEFLCPVKGGDIVVDKWGKKKAQVSRISPSWRSYEVHGCYFKKNGEVGRFEQRLSSFEGWQTVEEGSKK